DLLREAELVERAGLVLGERLRRVQVERAGARVAAEDVERRQVEAQRLARGGPRRDDRRPRPGGLERLGLVRVELVDSGAEEALAEGGVEVAGDRGEVRVALAFVRLADEALVGAAGVEEVGPGLGAARDGHP